METVEQMPQGRETEVEVEFFHDSGTPEDIFAEYIRRGLVPVDLLILAATDAISAGVIIGSTPLEGWPNFVFDMLNDEYVGAFQGSVVVGPNGGDLYVP
jgi:hypothetical protein